jgi:hypothetical protein
VSGRDCAAATATETARPPHGRAAPSSLDADATETLDRNRRRARHARDLSPACPSSAIAPSLRILPLRKRSEGQPDLIKRSTAAARALAPLRSPGRHVMRAAVPLPRGRGVAEIACARHGALERRPLRGSCVAAEVRLAAGRGRGAQQLRCAAAHLYRLVQARTGALPTCIEHLEEMRSVVRPGWWNRLWQPRPHYCQPRANGAAAAAPRGVARAQRSVFAPARHTLRRCIAMSNGLQLLLHHRTGTREPWEGRPSALHPRLDLCGSDGREQREQLPRWDGKKKAQRSALAEAGFRITPSQRRHRGCCCSCCSGCSARFSVQRAPNAALWSKTCRQSN